jgi:hypothetical protein
MYNAYIPSNLNLEIFLKEHPPRFKYNIDNFRYIIHLITEIPSFNKNMLEKNGHTLINKEELRERGIHDNKAYFQYLLKHNIIETDGYWIEGEKSQGYRFTPHYCTEMKIEPINKFTLLKAIARRKNKIIAEEKPTVKKYNYLEKWFNDDLQIDVPAAKDCLYELYKKDMKDKAPNARTKFYSNCMAVDRLGDHDFYFSQDQNVGRFHSNLTSLKKAARNHITYAGQPMVACDYGCSQVCLSAGLLNEKFFSHSSGGFSSDYSGIYSNATPIFNIYNVTASAYQYKPLFLNNTISTLHSSITLAKAQELPDNNNFTTFIRKAEEGVIYDYIAREVTAKLGRNFKDRKELKQAIFLVLFTDNRFIGQPDAEPKRIFRELFPAVYNIFNLIKRGDSTVLPRLLQTVESRLMLDHIAKRIALERPRMPIFTIHDSIVCPVGNEQYVAALMKQEMASAIGINPTVKFEYWRP